MKENCRVPASRNFPPLSGILDEPQASIKALTAAGQENKKLSFSITCGSRKKRAIKEYLKDNKINLTEKYSLTMTPSRIDLVADVLCQQHDGYRQGDKKDQILLR